MLYTAMNFENYYKYLLELFIRTLAMKTKGKNIDVLTKSKINYTLEKNIIVLILFILIK